MIYKIRLGDVGTVITLNFVQETSPGVFANVNVSAATTRTAELKPPSGGTSTEVACTAGPLNYQTHFHLGGQFDEVGTWRIRGFVSGDDFLWHSREVELQVEASD